MNSANYDRRAVLAIKLSGSQDTNGVEEVLNNLESGNK
jgi:hypothetical protein